MSDTLAEMALISFVKNEMKKQKDNEATEVMIRALDCYYEKLSTDYQNEVLKSFQELLKKVNE